MSSWGRCCKNLAPYTVAVPVEDFFTQKTKKAPFFSGKAPFACNSRGKLFLNGASVICRGIAAPRLLPRYCSMLLRTDSPLRRCFISPVPERLHGFHNNVIDAFPGRLRLARDEGMQFDGKAERQLSGFGRFRLLAGFRAQGKIVVQNIAEIPFDLRNAFAVKCQPVRNSDDMPEVNSL